MSRIQGFTGYVFNNTLVAAGAVILNPVADDEATLLAAVRGDRTKGEKLGGTTGGITFSDDVDFENLGDDIDGLTAALRGAMVPGAERPVTLETEVVEFVPGKLKNIQALLDEVPIFDDATFASTTRGIGNAAINIEADDSGPGGNDITYAHAVSGNSTPLSVEVAGKDITVRVATDGTGAATSTANQVITAINGNAAAAALVTASLPDTSDGTGVVSTSAKANLTGGTVGTNRVGTDYMPRNFIKDEDHIDKIALLIQGKDKAVRFAVILYNVLVTSGMSLETQNSLSEKISQGVTFTAMSGPNNFDPDSGTNPPPYKIRDFSWDPAQVAV